MTLNFAGEGVKSGKYFWQTSQFLTNHLCHVVYELDVDKLYLSPDLQKELFRVISEYRINDKEKINYIKKFLASLDVTQNKENTPLQVINILPNGSSLS